MSVKMMRRAVLRRQELAAEENRRRAFNRGVRAALNVVNSSMEPWNCEAQVLELIKPAPKGSKTCPRSAKRKSGRNTTA
jgi:hypothetical protein